RAKTRIGGSPKHVAQRKTLKRGFWGYIFSSLLGGVAKVAGILVWTPSHIVRPGFVDHIGERAVRADCPPHTGISFIWNNMREGFGVGHRATPRQPAGTGRRQYLVAYTLPKGT